MEYACFPCVCLGFTQVIQFPPTIQRMPVRLIDNNKLTCNRLRLCSGYMDEPLFWWCLGYFYFLKDYFHLHWHSVYTSTGFSMATVILFVMCKLKSLYPLISLTDDIISESLRHLAGSVFGSFQRVIQVVLRCCGYDCWNKRSDSSRCLGEGKTILVLASSRNPKLVTKRIKLFWNLSKKALTSVNKAWWHPW